MFTALDHMFLDVDQISDQCVIQETDSAFVTKPGTAGDRFNLGYRQIWLHAMRDYCKMLAEPKKKKKDLLAKVRGRKANETVLYELAAFAY